MTDIDLHPATREQLAGLPASDRPLIVCDVDEVALHFVRHLEDHLRSNGFELLPRSYGLTGNIVGIEDRRPADPDIVHRLIIEFFEVETRRQTPVDRVGDVLSAMTDHAEVVFLTNIPSARRQVRIDTLKDHGLDFPVITNSGDKGPAVQALAARAGRPVVFLDDSPRNVTSVQAHQPDAILIHFIADPRFFKLADPIDGVHLMTNDWAAVGSFLDDLFDRV